MLPKANRLPAPDVRLLLRKGKRLYSPMVQLIYGKNNLPVSRFAFIVSTKIDKRATARNRIRRLLSESVRLLLPSLAPEYDVLFIVRQKNRDERIGEVKQSVENLLRTAGL